MAQSSTLNTMEFTRMIVPSSLCRISLMEQERRLKAFLIFKCNTSSSHVLCLQKVKHKNESNIDAVKAGGNGSGCNAPDALFVPAFDWNGLELEC